MAKRSSYESLPKYGPAIPQRVAGTVEGLIKAGQVPDGRIGPERAGLQPLCVRTHYTPALYRVPLTEHFQLREFLFSRLALENDIDNTPKDRSILVSLMHILAPAMELVRENLGVPVQVTSGFRCDALNDLAGGVPDSFHRQGLAADFIAPHFGSPEDIFRSLSTGASRTENDARRNILRLRLEPRWVHLVARPPVSNPDKTPPRYSIDPRCKAHAQHAETPPPAAGALALFGTPSGREPRRTAPESAALDKLRELGLEPIPTLFAA